MPRDHDYFVYIVTNYTQTVLYIGVTSDLEGRLWEHANGEAGSRFTKKYHVGRLLFCEHFREVRDALAREKQLKGWTRAKKEALIRAINPRFEDLGVKIGLRGVRPEEGARGVDGVKSGGSGACRRPEGRNIDGGQEDIDGACRRPEGRNMDGGQEDIDDACRRPEDPSTALVPRSAQDDRGCGGKLGKNPAIKGPSTPLHSAQDDRAIKSGLINDGNEATEFGAIRRDAGENHAPESHRGL